MDRLSQKYFLSLVVSLVLTVLAAVIASLPNASAAGVLYLPGALGAAVIFAQGAHSGPYSQSAETFFLVAGILNTFFLSWPVLGVWVLIERFRRRNKRRLAETQ
jgi:hypothetical protein